MNRDSWRFARRATPTRLAAIAKRPWMHSCKDQTVQKVVPVLDSSIARNTLVDIRGRSWTRSSPSVDDRGRTAIGTTFHDELRCNNVRQYPSCRQTGCFDGDASMQPSEYGRGFWDLLPHEERRLLWSLGRDRDYSPGATLCVEGDPATHVFILLHGWVKVLATTAEGRESVLALRGAGDIVGETAGPTTGRRNATLQAMVAVRALIVGYSRFDSFLDTHRGSSRAYRHALTYRWRDADSMLRIRAATTGAQRLAGLLIDLAQRLGGQPEGVIEIGLPLSQDELASLAGTSRATVARALNGWRKRGLIRTGQRRITLTDVPGLRQAAGPARSSLS